MSSQHTVHTSGRVIAVAHVIACDIAAAHSIFPHFHYSLANLACLQNPITQEHDVLHTNSAGALAITGAARAEHAARLVRRPTLTAPARAGVSEARVDEETDFQIEQRN